MISRKTKQRSELSCSSKSTFSAAVLAATLVCSPPPLHAYEMQPSPRSGFTTMSDASQSESESLQIAKVRNHIIKFDNSRGTEKLEIQENLYQRQCIASVKPDSVTLNPGEIAEVHLDIRDSESSGCAGEPKYVLWRATVANPGGRPFDYQMLFTEDPREETHGGTQIRSTRSSRPGAPYAATCGDRACFDEWAPTSDGGSAIFFYKNT